MYVFETHLLSVALNTELKYIDISLDEYPDYSSFSWYMTRYMTLELKLYWDPAGEKLTKEISISKEI